MISEFRDRRSWTFALLFVTACCATICGCNRGPKMARVSGKVFYKDGTVPKAGICVVNFSPTRDSTAELRKGASGPIGPDGSFSMSTREPNDGVYVGEYAVTFGVCPGPTDPRSMILPKYSSAVMTPYKENIQKDTTDLKYTIEPLPGGPAPPATQPAEN